MDGFVVSKTDRCQRGREPVVRADGSIEIPLTRNQVALVDAESYHFVRECLWSSHLNLHTRSFVAITTTSRRPDRVTLYMHRVVTGALPDVVVDHINHDTLDNRLANLRVASVAENSRNARIQSGRASRFKGVTWHRRGNRWRARIGINGRLRNLGLFSTEEEAARAYDVAAIELHGEFAHTNGVIVPAKSRGQDPLRVSIGDGLLTISVGVETLAWAVEHDVAHGKFCPQSGEYVTPRVTDTNAWARELLRALEREEEDGSTPVSKLFETAMVAAIETGAEGIALPGRNRLLGAACTHPAPAEETF